MKPAFALVLLILANSSCNQPSCSNKANEILQKGDKNSWEYQHELMRLIDENPNKVDFYFEQRVAINGESFIIMNCYGPDFCGELKTIFVPSNVESIKLQNKGWRGAQLIGVDFGKANLANGNEVFTFEKLEKIID